MTSPPLTSREYAYFKVSGVGDPKDVTDRIGLQPTESWAKGAEHPRTGRSTKTMYWAMSSGLDDRAPLQQHIDNLLLFLTPKAEELKQLWVDYDLTIQCVGYYPPSGHGAHLGRDTVQAAARLGLSFDLDFYFVDDNGHDV